MPINQKLLDILVCPQPRQSLTLADAGEVAAINQRIARRELTTRRGATVTEPVGGALIRADRQGFKGYIIRGKNYQMDRTFRGAPHAHSTFRYT